MNEQMKNASGKNYTEWCNTSKDMKQQDEWCFELRLAERIRLPIDDKVGFQQRIKLSNQKE